MYVSTALIAKPAAIQGDKFTKSHAETATTVAIKIPIKFSALLEFVDLLFILWPEAESNCRPLVFQTSALPTELSGQMAGTTGFEPATSCVTGRRELQTSPRPRNT